MGAGARADAPPRVQQVRHDRRQSIIDNVMSAVPLQSLWSVTAPPGPACGTLQGAQRAQAAVIGAGYTGLSAALHLAEAGRDVLVLEAADIGERAAGGHRRHALPS